MRQAIAAYLMIFHSKAGEEPGYLHLAISRFCPIHADVDKYQISFG